MENNENFEKVLKKELGTFEKHLVDFQENMTNQMSDFKSEIKNEMSDFKSEIKNEMSNFKSEIKDEMCSFKSEINDAMSSFKVDITEEMNNFKTEVTDEIRERFFCFENDYGTTINKIYDGLLQNREITSKNSAELGIAQIKIKDLENLSFYHNEQIKEISSILNLNKDSKNVNSKT